MHPPEGKSWGRTAFASRDPLRPWCTFPKPFSSESRAALGRGALTGSSEGPLTLRQSGGCPLPYRQTMPQYSRNLCQNTALFPAGLWFHPALTQQPPRETPTALSRARHTCSARVRACTSQPQRPSTLGGGGPGPAIPPGTSV